MNNQHSVQISSTSHISYILNFSEDIFTLVSREVVPHGKCSGGIDTQHSSDSRRSASSCPPVKTDACSCSQSCNTKRQGPGSGCASVMIFGRNMYLLWSHVTCGVQGTVFFTAYPCKTQRAFSPGLYSGSFFLALFTWHVSSGYLFLWFGLCILLFSLQLTAPSFQNSINKAEYPISMGFICIHNPKNMPQSSLEGLFILYSRVD